MMVPVPSIPERLWAICNPETGEIVSLRHAHTAEAACGQAAYALGWSCTAFQLSYLPGARAIESEGEAATLYAANITGMFPENALGDLVGSDLGEVDAEGDYYIARSLD